MRVGNPTYWISIALVAALVASSCALQESSKTKSADQGSQESLKCDYKVVHIPQKSIKSIFLPQESNASYSWVEIEESQFKIARFIRQNLKHNIQDIPYFSEQVPVTLNLEKERRNLYSSSIRRYQDAFPSGLPSAVSSLSSA